MKNNVTPSEVPKSKQKIVEKKRQTSIPLTHIDI
jgi:hypothetical protein